MADTKKINPIQLQKFLGGIDYPADKEQVVQTAKRHHAPQEVIEFLGRLPMNKFNSPNDISEAVGKVEN